jgi:NhaP-type Na+/H+ or K+/H+ antiporter
MDHASLTLSLAMLFGVLAQAAARHVRVPGIVVLLAVGVALGPDGLGLIRPRTMGAALHDFVGFAVAVILFDGGLHMQLRRLLAQATPIRRLVTVGAAITGVGGAVAAAAWMGWGARAAILFGTLVIVTGPTVITPLVRGLRLETGLATILEAEGIFIDAIGATIAVVALEVALVPSGVSLAVAVPDIALRIGAGAGVGAAGGAVLAGLLRRRGVIPEGLENALALATAVAVFHASNALVHESGITAAIVAGMVLSNATSHAQRALVEFKAQLTALLVATIFVLLAADVRIAEVEALGWRGVGTVATLMLIVRPLSVAVSTRGTGLVVRQKLFLAWLAPRGIVAAAVASLFAIRLDEAGIEGGAALRALVFLVVALTVVVQGTTSGVVARLLRVRRPSALGYLVLGANPLARLVAGSLRDGGQVVRLLDSDPAACAAARAAGLDAEEADGLDEVALVAAQADARIACLGLTANENVNFLFARRVREAFREPRVLVGLESAAVGVTAAMVRGIGAGVLFGRECHIGTWCRAIDAGRVRLERWGLDGASEGGVAWQDIPVDALVPLVRHAGATTEPVADGGRLRRGDRVDFAIDADGDARARTWLRAVGFSPAPSPLHRGGPPSE